MTDGIIQQTFKNLLGRSRYLSYEDDGNDDRYVNTDFIKEAEQELIEKIKQLHIDNDGEHCTCSYLVCEISDLIGDNNEW